MRIKQNQEISTQDFYYDLFDGGYIKPEDVCEYQGDANRVIDAIKIITEFKESCEEQIEDFIQ